MKFLNEKELEKIRQEYPVGERDNDYENYSI